MRLAHGNLLPLEHDEHRTGLAGPCDADPDESIALDDALASRHHAVIQKVKGELFIEDLHSTNGTLVNAAPVPPGKYVRLRQSDIILVGRTELSVQALAPGEP